MGRILEWLMMRVMVLRVIAMSMVLPRFTVWVMFMHLVLRMFCDIGPPNHWQRLGV